jgi:hypothetical protein
MREEASGYPVGLVGESNYQLAINACAPGQRVEILHEIGNPYDELALVVKTEKGGKLGYIGRDCWLVNAIHNELHGCEARVLSINPGPHGAGVVIDVVLHRGDVDQCAYQP